MIDFCPKCGHKPLRKQFLRGNVVWFCIGCGRGYPEYLLRAIREEVDMTLGLEERFKNE